MGSAALGAVSGFSFQSPVAWGAAPVQAERAQDDAQVAALRAAEERRMIQVGMDAEARESGLARFDAQSAEDRADLVERGDVGSLEDQTLRVARSNVDDNTALISVGTLENDGVGDVTEAEEISPDGGECPEQVAPANIDLSVLSGGAAAQLASAACGPAEDADVSTPVEPLTVATLPPAQTERNMF